MISSKVGSPVTGEDFFDREDEQRQMWEYLGGDDLLLLAPRRVGKTSLMLRLRDTAADRDVEAVYLSVAGAEDETGFVENDGYLVQVDRRYRFRSPLLREFWLRRVVP